MLHWIELNINTISKAQKCYYETTDKQNVINKASLGWMTELKALIYSYFVKSVELFKIFGFSTPDYFYLPPQAFLNFCLFILHAISHNKKQSSIHKRSFLMMTFTDFIYSMVLSKYRGSWKCFTFYWNSTSYYFTVLLLVSRNVCKEAITIRKR